MYVYIIVALFTLSSAAYSAEECRFRGINSFYERVEQFNPINQEISSQKTLLGANLDVAKMRPNPEFELELLRGQQGGEDVNSIGFQAQHVVELGSKRQNRINKTYRQKDLIELELDIKGLQAKLEAVSLFKRVSQLDLITSSIKEAIGVFNKIIKKLTSRARLNPEERVSLSTLELAANDYNAQLIDLENEKEIAIGKLSFLSGCNITSALYSEIKLRRYTQPSQDVELKGLSKLEDYKKSLAKSDLDIEKSLGYSNLSIGPRIEYQNQLGQDALSIGVALNFQLPLFHTNNGGKKRALQRVLAQDISSQNMKNRLLIKRKALVNKYNKLVSVLKKMPSLREIEEKHENVEKLFSRGLVSIPMTIESHRQQVDFLKSKFDLESDAVNTFININLIDGDHSSLKSIL